MPVAIAQIAKPPSSGPGLESHRHALTFGCVVLWPELLEERLECHLERCPHVNLLCNVQCQMFNARCCDRTHSFLLSLFIFEFEVLLESSRPQPFFRRREGSRE